MTNHYRPTWDSLQQHVMPTWLVNAKFGIYFHWGVYSVPACGPNGSWYPHNMYRPGTKQYNHHVKTFGDPSKFGYKDFIPMFTAEKFDPAAWARLIKGTGARFAGPVAEHHDGFSMWPSKVNPWNAGAMGPKRDIVGEIAKALRDEGLKFLVAFHHAENWWFYPHWEKAYDTADPKYAGLYGPLHDQDADPGKDWEMHEQPTAAFWEQWKAKIFEVMDAYRPDVMWFDFGLRYVPDQHKREVLARFYNRAIEWGKEVGVIYKMHDLPPNIGLLDFELGRSRDLADYRWITDTSVDDQGAWGYVKEAGFKPSTRVIHALIDQVAKNGAMLLNFGPKPDGEIPLGAQQCLREIGEWMRINRDAIHDTNPWCIAEEGPIKTKRSGMFSERRNETYTPLDLRFMVKENALFICCLGWPGKELHVRTLIETKKALHDHEQPWSIRAYLQARSLLKGTPHPNRRAIAATARYLLKKSRLPRHYFLDPALVQAIELLGHPEPLKWAMTGEGLKVQMPDTMPCKSACTFKITFKQ
nr:alpha-L-fucosidase [Candidatus Sigynarchaeota archaeon]